MENLGGIFSAFSAPLRAPFPWLGIGCDRQAGIRHHRACPEILPIRYFTGKSQSQGNGCQGNGKKRFQNHSPDSHSLDMSPAFSIRHPPSSPWLRLAARRILRLWVANHRKCFSMRNLHFTLTVSIQA
jgi:hypothetical protein